MLNLMKMMFHLNGTLSGYKTYVVAFAGVMAVTVSFLTTSVIPAMGGDITYLAVITEALPRYIEDVSLFFMGGAIRAGIEGSSK